jgi:hypothetical protein
MAHGRCSWVERFIEGVYERGDWRLILWRQVFLRS